VLPRDEGRSELLHDRCDTLGALWRAWSAVLDGLSAEAWRRPTRLEGWDVAALVAHHSLYPGAVTKWVQRRVDGPPTIASAAALLRRFNQPRGAATTLAPKVADQARAVATGTPTPELARRFRDEGPTAIVVVRAAGPIVIDFFGHGTIDVGEALTVAALEATVHLLDLHDALGRAPQVPERGLATSAALLARVADPVTFIEAATGRTSLNPLPLVR